MRRLSDRERKLIDEYFSNGFVQVAAIEAAGFKSRPGSYSARLFKRPRIVKEIERRRKKLAEKHELTVEWLIEQYMEIVAAKKVLAKFLRKTADGKLDWDFSDATEEELALINGFQSDVYMEGRGDGARAVKKFKLDAIDAKGALDSLAKLAGAFIDKKEITGANGGPVVVETLDIKELARRMAFLLNAGVQAEEAEKKEEI